MIHPVSGMRAAVADARFEPRLVVTGVAVLAAFLIVTSVLFWISSNQADKVAAPVLAVCSEGGEAGTKLAASGACQAAGDTAAGVGPYKSGADPQVQAVRGAPGATGATGPGGGPGTPGTPGGEGPAGEPGGAGASGEPGTPGTPGTAGEPGTPGAAGEPGADSTVAGPAGPPGAPGADGVSPACLSEPGQCRGPEGPAGTPGAPGTPGTPGADGAPAPASETFALPDGRIFTCARTGGDDLDPLYRCEQTGSAPTTETS